MHPVIPATIRRRLDPEQRYGLRVTLLAAAFILVAVPFGFLLDQVVSDGPVTELDLDLSVRLIAMADEHAWFRAGLEVISFIGKPIFLLFVVGLPVLWLLRHSELRLAIFLTVTALVGGFVDTVIKVAVNRPRPQFDGEPLTKAFGNSFPSGHALASVVCYGAVLLVLLPYLPRQWRRPTIGLTALVVLAIGLSRLGLGVHYTSDVIAGYVLGLAWLMAATAAFSIWRVERGGQRPAPVKEGLEPEADPALIEAHQRADHVDLTSAATGADATPGTDGVAATDAGTEVERSSRRSEASSA